MMRLDKYLAEMGVGTRQEVDAAAKRLGDWLRRELPGFLTRDTDRPLFDELLKEKQPESGTTEPEPAANDK